MHFTHHLSVRLFLLLFISMTVVFSLFLFFNIRLQEKHLLASATVSGARSSDLLVSALRHSMLQNNRDEIYNAIQTIGAGKDIRGVRIINKMGEITFSSRNDEIGARVDMSAEACLMCHSASRPLSVVTDPGRTRIFLTPNKERVLGIISPIQNASECSNNACHAHPPEATILGVLDLKLSLSQTSRFLAESNRYSLLIGTISIFVFAMLFGLLINTVIQKPVKKLTIATEEISRGNLDYHMDLGRNDEIGQLARSFNNMTAQLKEARDEITQWNRELEERVEKKRRKLQQVEEHMRQIDKLASLGTLAASIAHELNNPLAGILTYTKLTERKLQHAKENLDPEVPRFLQIMQQETARCGKIVKDLLLFARRDVGEFCQASVRDIVAKSLDIVLHKISMQEITVEKHLNLTDDTIECDPAQIQQALVALLVNATEAIATNGTITITTAKENSHTIAIDIQDTGGGISPETQAHIFEPFFSTKEEKKGVGLGLSVVYGIIRRHKGNISVTSEIGKGATFHITLPHKQATDTVASEHRIENSV